MHPKYPNMFSPIKLGPVEIPNRFFFSPHGVHLTIAGKPTDDYVAYQAARAAGGTGLIICSTTVTERARHSQPSAYLPENIPAFRALADAVHARGSKIFAQVWYNWITQGHWQPFSPPVPALSASKVQFGHNDRSISTHEMGLDEIRAMGDAMRQTCTHLREAGFDGIMLHTSHGGMMEQFLSPYFNHRTDDYGGSFENRLRFLRESLEIAREAAGPDMAVGMRYNCDEMLPGGYGTGYSRDVLERLTDAGLLDFVDLDVAVEPNQLQYGMPPIFVEPHVYQPFVEAVRDACGDVPVLSVLARLTSLAHGEKVIADGICDMVGATRALIAEPELLKNAKDGTEELSRTCIACNWCLMAMSEGAQGCTINPASYRERLWGVGTFAPAPKRCKVVIVGGGPSGLEAARVSALRGHDVTLFEARGKLGGGVAIWATLPGREIYQLGIDWWVGELARLGVNVKLGTEARAEAILAEEPDAVIVATGAAYSKGGHSILVERDVPGFDRDFVYRPEDILIGGVRPQGKVVLLDTEGLHTSVGTAEILGLAGADVEYVMPGFSPVSARLNGMQDTKFVMQRLRAADVKISGSTYIRSIDDHRVTVYDVHSEQERVIEDVSAVVLSTGRVPIDGLARELEGKVDQLFTIGDALAARLFATASYEGHKFARYIGEPGAPKTFAETFFQKNSAEFSPRPAEMA